MNEVKKRSHMKKHILCIDDEAPIRELLREILILKGYRVSIAASAVEAKLIMEQDLPQLIITDLQLDNDDGLVMINKLKQLAPEVPVLLLTGVAFDPIIILDTIRKQVSSYMNKTDSLLDVVKEIRRLLGEDVSDTLPA